MPAGSAPCFALIAGEASGDNLGAALIEALRARFPGARFVGVPGPRMQAAGCEALATSEELAVMGLFEILKELPRLFALRARLLRELSAIRPDVFIGIDAPEFNLRMAAKLKRAGIPTVQYVSPQVWAWRQGRVRHIGEVVSVPVKVSVAAQERLQAARVAGEKDAFDQEKVDRIRREIAEGSFPIDEERLARKFLELEKQLGDLGR